MLDKFRQWLCPHCREEKRRREKAKGFLDKQARQRAQASRLPENVQRRLLEPIKNEAEAAEFVELVRPLRIDLQYDAIQLAVRWENGVGIKVLRLPSFMQWSADNSAYCATRALEGR